MKKIIKKAVAFVLVFAIAMSITLTVFGIYVNNKNDYELDERLFSAARESNYLTYSAYDSNGDLVSVGRESNGAAKSWISLNDVSEHLIKGFISAEDKEFYKHNGVNLRRSILALLNQVVHYTSGFGASTITQQVIKNISGDNEHSFRRKASEILRAIHIEASHSKDEILEMYLNIVPMSGNVIGVREASNMYFGIEPSELDIAEAATLVGIANAPGRYDPYTKAEACIKKRNTVLYAMLNNGVINEQEYNESINEPLDLKRVERRDQSVISWFAETAREDVINDLCDKYSLSRSGALLLLKRGCNVVLTENIEVQRILENYFSDSDHFPMEISDGLEYAMTVFDSKSGDLVGIVGRVGSKTGNRLLNLATALHPPASTIKPLSLYTPAIDDEIITWSTVVNDEPKSAKGDIHYPKNSPDIYEGKLTVAESLRKSKNTVAVELYDKLGSQRIFNDLFKDFGFTSLIKHRSLDGRTVTDIGAASLALGQLTDGISLRDITRAYTSFPRDGLLGNGRSYFGVFDHEGNVILDNRDTDRRVFSKESARVMTQMLMTVSESGTARSLTLDQLVDTAAKTGTSSGNKDKLLIGYTPYFTAGLWSGYVSGDKGIFSVNPTHIHIWDEVMKEIHEVEVFGDSSSDPDSFSTLGIIGVNFCTKTGEIATDGCIIEGCCEFGYFKPGTEPKNECPIH